MNELIKETRHVGITVTNMESSLKFYKDILGLKIVRIMDESGQYIDNMLNMPNVKVKTVKMSVNDGSTLIELLEFKSHPNKPSNMEISRIGTSHLALTVYDLQKCYDDLSKHGIKDRKSTRLNSSH